MSVFRTHLLLASLGLTLAACATSHTESAADWNRPFVPATTPPVFSHDLAITNPPYPRPYYPNYLDEPTRFEFRGRPFVGPQEDAGTDQTDESTSTYPYLENGILYVDPDQ